MRKRSIDTPHCVFVASPAKPLTAVPRDIDVLCFFFRASESLTAQEVVGDIKPLERL